MKNAINRGIPEELLKDGKEVYRGKYYMDGKYIRRDSPGTRRYVKPQSSKLCSSIREACEHCGTHDGVTVSFHSEFQERGCITSMVAKVLVEEMSLKDITIAATSLGNTRDLIADYIEQGEVIGVQTSGVHGQIGEVISAGELATPSVIRSHGRRPCAVETKEVHIDIIFLVASTSDCWGSAKGVDGKNNCDSMRFTIYGSHYADHTVIITGTLIDFLNRPSSISAENADCVCAVDSIGDATKIATEEARVTENLRGLMIAEHAAEVVAATPYFTDGLSFQTGAGGPSLAVNRFIEKRMVEKRIKMSFALDGVTSTICQLLDKGLVGAILDTQDFDMGTIKHLAEHPEHHEISMSGYTNPANEGAYVNRLDFVVLSALEIDINFSVDVITGSDGILRDAPDNHPDAAVGSKCCIIITPLTHGRMTTVCDEAVAVTTPGDCMDILVTDYGTAVNPLRNDLTQCLDAAGIEHVAVEWPHDKACSLVGAPGALEQEDQVVAVMEARDGTLLDVVREIRPFRLDG